jgi:hypothetical protein
MIIAFAELREPKVNPIMIAAERITAAIINFMVLLKLVVIIIYFI